MGEHAKSLRKRRGDVVSTAAARVLDVPACPAPLAYLRALLFRVHARSGVGMHGPAPLMLTTLLADAQLYGTAYEPWEMDELLWADAVLLNPPTETDAHG